MNAIRLNLEAKKTSSEGKMQLRTMNKHNRSMFLAVSSGALLFCFQAAQAQETRFYIRADGGGNWTQDTDLKEFFGPVAPGTKVSFDPGVRFGFAGGYDVTDWFAAEAQVGVFANNIKSVTGASRVDATFSNVPFLLNARFQWPNKSLLTPYIGGGVGGSASTLDADHIDLGGTTLHGSQSTAVFAYQAFGGLRFRLNPRMGLSLEYRYFATGEPEWEADSTFGTTSDRLRFGGAQTHAVSLAFDYRF
ncbi:MAG: surface antigen msp4 family protein [Pedosphaera sp.]|nr:surface antigen msp4 family protein [Pedosphaera sp.]